MSPAAISNPLTALPESPEQLAGWHAVDYALPIDELPVVGRPKLKRTNSLELPPDVFLVQYAFLLIRVG